MDNQNKILFVINPIAGGKEKNELQLKVDRFIKDKALAADTYKTTGEGDVKEIEKRIDEQKPSIAVAIGGDGTVNMLAGILSGKSVKLGIIPAGSANGLASDLGIPLEIDQALDVLVDGRPRKMDAVRINGKYISVHLSDMGLNARIVKRFDKEKVRGFFGYAKQAVKEIRKRELDHFTIEANGQDYQTKAHMVVIANAKRYGTGAVINPPGKTDDGKFEIVVIKPYPAYVFLPLIWNFFTGRLDKMKNIRILSTQKATVKTNREQELQVDGEPKGIHHRVEAEIEPAALEVLLPIGR